MKYGQAQGRRDHEGSPLTQGRELKLEVRENTAILIRSPLTQGRELKFYDTVKVNEDFLSPLTQGRELKLLRYHTSIQRAVVAPHAGAGIEIFVSIIVPSNSLVAPHAGAGIEIRCPCIPRSC